MGTPFRSLRPAADAVWRVWDRCESKRAQVLREFAVPHRVTTASDNAVSLLADSVMHEVNNPLSYVLGNLEYLARRLRELERSLPPEVAVELRETAQDAISGSKRIHNLMQGLRAMATADDDEPPAPVDVANVADGALSFMRHELRQRATVVSSLADVPLAMAAEKHLMHVIVMLLRNAAESITPGRTQSNEIRLSTKVEGQMVAVEVTDTGTGIAPEHVGRVFEPFFTTKVASEGVGLGLSLSRRLVRSMGGHLELRSRQGRGTTVRIALAQAESVRRFTSVPPPGGGRTHRRRRVLVVDDDRMIGRAIARVLEDHEVTFVESGEEALAVLQVDRDFDVVLCDLMMPNMSGATLHARVQQIAPEVAKRFRFITGGACTEETKSFAREHQTQVMQKPLMTSDLRHVVERQLSRYRK